MSDIFRLYGNKNIKFLMLKEDEQIELFKKYCNGDKSAYEKLVKGNLGLVSYVIDKYFSNLTFDEKEEIFQEGCLGLQYAINKFDINFGNKFSTYAVPFIYGVIRTYRRDNNTIRISRSLKDLFYKIQNNNLECYSISQISKILDVDEKIIAEILSFNMISLDDYIDNYNKILISDAIVSDINIENEYEKKEELQELKQAIQCLDEIDANIINMYYGINCKKCTQKEISEIVCISQAQVSRRIKISHQKLKHILQSNLFKDNNKILSIKY